MSEHSERSLYDKFKVHWRRSSQRARRWWRDQPKGTWVQIGLLIVTASYTFVTYRLLRSTSATQQMAAQQLDVANRNLQLAAAQAEANDRAWLKVDLTLSQPTKIVNRSAALFPVWTTSNIGRTVAIQISNEWSWYVESFSQQTFHEPVEFQKQLAREQTGPIAFEQAECCFRTRSNLEWAPSQSARRISKRRDVSPNSMATAIIIAGCVGYSYGTSARRHHTGFIYTLHRYVAPGQAVALTPDWLFSAPLPSGSFTVDPFFFAAAPVD